MPAPDIARAEPRITYLWIYDQYFRRLVEHPFLDCAVEAIEAGADASGYYQSENFCRTWQNWIDTGEINPYYKWVSPKIRVASMED